MQRHLGMHFWWLVEERGKQYQLFRPETQLFKSIQPNPCFLVCRLWHHYSNSFSLRLTLLLPRLWFVRLFPLTLHPSLFSPKFKNGREDEKALGVRKKRKVVTTTKEENESKRIPENFLCRVICVIHTKREREIRWRKKCPCHFLSYNNKGSKRISLTAPHFVFKKEGIHHPFKC